MQIFAIVVSLTLTAVATVAVSLAVRRILAVLKSGQPAPGRGGNPVGRSLTMVKETFGHTRMLQWHWIGIMHWFVYAAFLFLSSAVLTGYFQLFDPEFALPIIGHWRVYEWTAEFLGLLSTIGIVVLIIYRQVNHPRRKGRQSRFYGSNGWQAYFVELMALGEGAAILFIRGAEFKLIEDAERSHFPLSSWVGEALFPDSPASLENIIFFIAMFKIVLAMVWLLVIARYITMGIAWHRFTAWFNIWFKREDSGRTALGALKPLTSEGKAITLDDIDDLDEDSRLGVGSIEDFSWKGLLDFTTCTECGRCQSQCPAWNTEKPLSPKLLIMGMRDHAYAKAPYVQADEDTRATLVAEDPKLAIEAERPLVGKTDPDDWFYMPENGAAVIDEDVLWSCTSCGACVQQCPVDIEHVDHIIDMRRYQVLVESNFPAELNGLFKGLENKGNPWNMSPNARMDWAKGLEFDVPVVGEDIESLDSVDWLFWVGCAGAYEDRAKKTTRAVAELLDIAGVSFGVLGNGETCTGDPARRAGNEFVFQGLAQQNVETFKEYKVKKVVSTCAHCFNTLKNEYKDFGIELEVIHHTQLLNRLVREGKLTPVNTGAGAHKRSITYHDPCYIGRHNGVYTPPRELLQVLPGAEFVEMERNSEKSFCCGAGGARMWMEENIGERINVNRTKEAVGTGADQIAVGCPFCRVMLSDGLTAQQAKGEAREEVEILDVAQMLLASVKGEQATKLLPGASAAAAAAAPPATTASPAVVEPVETKAEPAQGDVTITEDTVVETEDVGAAAKASPPDSSGGSLFDAPAPAEKPAAGGSLFDTPAPAEEKPAASGSLFDTPAPAPAEDKPASGGSLFDVDTPTEDEPKSGGSLFDVAAPEAVKPTAPAAKTPAPDLNTGGSLFDIPAAPAESAPPIASEPAESAQPVTSEPAESAEPVTSKPQAAPAVDLNTGGSLFDIPAAPAESAPPVASKPAESAEPVTSEPAESAEPVTSAPQAAPAVDLNTGGSLFDIPAAPVESAPPVATEPAESAEPVASEPAESAEPVAEPAAESAEPVAEPAAVTPSPAPEAAAPRADVDFDNLGSLFDIEAPEAQTTTAAPAPVAEVAETEAPVEAEAVDVAPEPEVAADEPETTSEPDTQAATTEPEPVQPEQPEEEPAPTKPTASGAAHQPRTDVDINGSGSLFDL